MIKDEILARIETCVDLAFKKMEYYANIGNKDAAKCCNNFIDWIYDVDTDSMDIPKLKGFLIEVNERFSIL